MAKSPCGISNRSRHDQRAATPKMETMKTQLITALLTVLSALVKIPGVIRLLGYLTAVLLHAGKGYRSRIIIENLESTIGKEMQKSELFQLKERYYQVLQRYFIESVNLAVSKPDIALSWVEMTEDATWKSWFHNQKSTIIMASHYGNWELVVPLLPALLEMKVVGFYKPLSNAAVDRWVRKNRGRFGLDLQPIEQTARVMASIQHENAAYIFISDQSPVTSNGMYWNTFLGRKTPWLTGAEKLAKKFAYPVVYLQQIPMQGSDARNEQSHVQPKGKALYQLAFHMLEREPSLTQFGEITEKYCRFLEHEIQQDPRWWLWSHRRWKRANPAS